jgi:hypothetical protein
MSWNECARAAAGKDWTTRRSGRAQGTLARVKKALPSPAVLNDFTPLNVIVGESGVGICDYARMTQRGTSYNDVALFLAAVETLEKY